MQLRCTRSGIRLPAVNTIGNPMADLPPLPEPFQRVVSPETGLIDPDWYRWFQALVDYAQDMSVTDDINTELADKAGLAQVDCWSDFIIKAGNGDIVVVQKVNFAGTITSIVTDCDAGTCSVQAKIDGVSVGVANNSVSTTETEQMHSAANTFTAGQTISYTISSNSGCLGARVQINYSRNLAA